MSDRPVRPTQPPPIPEHLSEEEQEICMLMGIMTKVAEALRSIADDPDQVERVLRSVSVLHGCELVRPGEGPVEHR